MLKRRSFRRSSEINKRHPSSNTLRLEGIVVQKRLTHVETTRYLVLDFLTGSISVYKKPPPKDDFAATQSQSVRASTSSKLMSSLKRSVSDSDTPNKSNVTCEHLAHLVRKPRIVVDDSWEPKFTVPGKMTTE